jgi:hypothetical protein
LVVIIPEGTLALGELIVSSAAESLTGIVDIITKRIKHLISFIKIPRFPHRKGLNGSYDGSLNRTQEVVGKS